jgi:hypothetical protein
MKSNVDIEKQLKHYAHFETDDDIANFDLLVSEISESKDPKNIPMLIHVLDDETEFPEVMDSIVHALDCYPDDVHAKGVIESIPYLLKNAPRWLLRLTYRTLNNPNSLILFKQNIHLIPKKEMIDLLDLVAGESENHRHICSELKYEVLKNNN